MRQELNNLLEAARQEPTDNTVVAQNLMKDLLECIVDEVQLRCMKEAKAEDEDSERTKIAIWRMIYERTATHAALSSSD